MAQGAENDLKDIRFFTNTSKVDFVEDNESADDLNFNTLVVDNKAILAKNTANASQTELGTHIGGSGVAAHPASTTTVAGFISAADQAKLDGIQVEAQINILSPLDALELVSGGVTRLHTHIDASAANDGLMPAADKAKLDTIQIGAQVNILTGAQVTGLIGGGDANSYHTHVTPTFTETFKAGPGTDGVPPGVTYHTNVDHTGLTGVPGSFPGFVPVPYQEGPTLINTVFDVAFSGIEVFSKDYSPFLSELAVVTGGISYIADAGSWGLTETFFVNDLSKSGLIGTITYQIIANNPVASIPVPDWSTIAGDGLMTMRCWQGGYGISV